MGEIVELNRHFSMTPEQAIEKASRYEFNRVLILGYTEDRKILVSSDMSDMQAFWMLSQAAHTVLQGKE